MPTDTVRVSRRRRPNATVPDDEKKFLTIRPTFLWPELQRGATPSAALKDAATWYYALTRRRREAFTFSGPEAMALSLALRGVEPSEDMIDVLYAKVEQGMKATRAHEANTIDVPALVAKVKGLDDLGTIALLEAIDRFWRLRDESQPALDQLREVGLAP